MSMTKMIFVDVESVGGISPFSGVMTSFGAVEFESRETFHGVLYDAIPNPENPAISIIVSNKEYDKKAVMTSFDAWLASFGERPIFVSDNNGYDFMWVAHAFDEHLGRNPFGHSSRRIGDLAAGLSGEWKKQSWYKKLRVTKHDHNPVNDAMGNVEAFSTMLEMYNQKL